MGHIVPQHLQQPNHHARQPLTSSRQLMMPYLLQHGTAAAEMLAELPGQVVQLLRMLWCMTADPQYGFMVCRLPCNMGCAMESGCPGRQL